MIWRSWVGRSSDEYGRVTWRLEVQLMKDVIDWSNLSPIVMRATRVLSLLHPSIHPSTDNICQQHPHRIHCSIREAAIEKYDKLLWLVGAFAFGAESDPGKVVWILELEKIWIGKCPKISAFPSQHCFHVYYWLNVERIASTMSVHVHGSRILPGRTLVCSASTKLWKASRTAHGGWNDATRFGEVPINPEATTGPFSFEALQVSPGKNKGIRDFEGMLRQTSHSL